MGNDYNSLIINYFLEEAEIETVFAWGALMPSYPGNVNDRMYYLYEAINTACLIRNYDLEEASEKIIQVRNKLSDSKTCQLVWQWFLAETDPMNHDFNFLDNMIDELEKYDYSTDGDEYHRIDYQTALTGAHILRFVISSQLALPNEYDHEKFGLDIQYLENGKCPDSVLVWVRFIHRYIEAENRLDYDKLDDYSLEWISMCRKGLLPGDETEYVDSTVITYELNGENVRAINLIDQAIKMCTDKERFLIMKARKLRNHGEIAGSSEAGHELLDLFPDSYMGYCLLTQNKLAENKYQEALELAETACRLFPDTADCYINRAFIEFQMEQYEDALSDFRISADNINYKYDSLRGIGRCLVLLKREKEALEFFCSLCRQYEDPDIYFELSDLYLDGGWIYDAARMCRKCLKLDPCFAGAYFQLAAIAEIEGKDDLAIALYEKCLEIEPDHTAAMTALALVLQTEGYSERALELVDQALDTTSDYADAMYAKGSILFGYGNFEEAEMLFDRTLEYIPDHVPALAARGNSLVQLGEYDEAAISLDHALELEPDNLDACHGKLSLCRELGLEKEEQLWQKRIITIESRIEDYESENGQEKTPDHESFFDDYDI